MKMFKNKTAVATIAASVLSLFGHNAVAKQSVDFPTGTTVDTSLSSIDLQASLLDKNPSGPEADQAREALIQLARNGRRGGNRGHNGGGRRGGADRGNRGGSERGNRGGRGGHERSGHTGYAC